MTMQPTAAIALEGGFSALVCGNDPRSLGAPRIVVVSGGFDPLHEGHIACFREAKRLGDVVVAILNDDRFLARKRRRQGMPGKPFLPLSTRVAVISELRSIDVIVVSIDTDDTVCATLQALAQSAVLRPHIFANGGDRKEGTVPEDAVCARFGIEMRYGVGGSDKPQSSSWLLQRMLDGKEDGTQ